MGHLVVFVLALFAGSAYAGSARILGPPTRIEEHPYLVQVDTLNSWTNTWSQSCAATILNEVYLLTAAHCFEGRVSPNRRIRAGATMRNAGGQVAPVVGVVPHPAYGLASRWDADIAVVRTTFLNFGPTVAQANLVSHDSTIPDNYVVRIAGWGFDQLGGFSEGLRHATVYTINNGVCAQKYANLPEKAVVTPNMICTGIPAGGRDHCQGDAGGGIYTPEGRIVIGVLSWGHECGNPDFPGVSISVPPYSQWIFSQSQ